MRIINDFPVCVAKRQYGIWRVTAHFTNGNTHFKDYETSTMAQGLRSYLMEFGPICGTVHAKFQKPIDK